MNEMKVIQKTTQPRSLPQKLPAPQTSKAGDKVTAVVNRRTLKGDTSWIKVPNEDVQPVVQVVSLPPSPINSAPTILQPKPKSPLPNQSLPTDSATSRLSTRPLPTVPGNATKPRLPAKTSSPNKPLPAPPNIATQPLQSTPISGLLERPLPMPPTSETKPKRNPPKSVTSPAEALHRALMDSDLTSLRRILCLEQPPALASDRPSATASWHTTQDFDPPTLGGPNKVPVVSLLDGRDNDGHTPLHVAILHAKSDAAAIILEASLKWANPFVQDLQKNNCFHLCVMHKNPAMLKNAIKLTKDHPLFKQALLQKKCFRRNSSSYCCEELLS